MTMLGDLHLDSNRGAVLPAVALADIAVSPTDYFSADGSERGTPSPLRRGRRNSLSIQIPPNGVRTDMAFTALQYLPMPVLVLSSNKSIVLANEASGRLFGLDDGEGQIDGDTTEEANGVHDKESFKSPTDVLYGVSLGQLGIDLLQGGNAVFIAWDDFLDSIVTDASRAQRPETQLNTLQSRNHPHDTTPTEKKHDRSASIQSSRRSAGPKRWRTEVHDAVVDVVFSTNRDARTGLPLLSRVADFANHVHAQMIVSVWATEDEQYFTCTFTSAKSDHGSGSQQSGDSTSRTTTRTVTRTATSLSTISSGMSSSSSSGSSGQRKRDRSDAGTPSSNLASPSAPPLMDFLPRGPPGKFSGKSAPTIFTKANRLKDAILNSMNMPAYAMWKDESFGIPNKAAIKLIYPWIEDGVYDSNEQAKDFLSHYVLYREDFSEEIPIEEFPIMRLMREKKAFENYRVGMYSAKDSSRLLFDVSGEVLSDEKGEFLGGLVLFNDITEYAITINRQRKENAEQFEDICNMVPQLIVIPVWVGSPD